MINDSTSIKMRKYWKHGIAFAEFDLKNNTNVIEGNQLEDTIIYSVKKFDLPFFSETKKPFDTLKLISEGHPILIDKDLLHNLCNKIYMIEKAEDYNKVDYQIFEIGRKTGITPNLYSKYRGISYESESDFRKDIDEWKNKCNCEK